MRNLKKPYQNTSEFLGEVCRLKELFDSSWKLKPEMGKNVRWYCEYRIHQHYEKCFSKKDVLKYKKYRLWSGTELASKAS